MNVATLNNELIDNTDNIIKVLTKLGHERIQSRGKYITFANISGDNPNACSILTETLSYQNFSHGGGGNIYTLVMDDLGCGFPKALDTIAKWLGITKTLQYDIHLPFNAFYKNVLREQLEPESGMRKYSEDRLPPLDSFSKLFVDDHISVEAQKHFGVRYCHEDDCILIPVYNMNNELVGVKARNNSNDDYNNRWYAWIPYAKTHVVYGLNWNYKNIINKKTLIIVESEKAVMQAWDFGLYCVVAIGGHSISETQARIIKSLMVENIIIAFDESICEDEIKYEASKLCVNNFTYKNNVSYIYDKNHDYLRLESKDSPMDNGKETWKNLYKYCRFRYEVKKNEN